MRNKQITKISSGATEIIIRTPLDVFDTSYVEMVEDHYRVVMAIAHISEVFRDNKMADIAVTIKGMKEHGMFDIK